MERQKMKLIEDDLENAEDRLSQAQKRAEKAETELEEKTRLAVCMHAYWYTSHSKFFLLAQFNQEYPPFAVNEC